MGRLSTEVVLQVWVISIILDFTGAFDLVAQRQNKISVFRTDRNLLETFIGWNPPYLLSLQFIPSVKLKIFLLNLTRI